MSAACGAPFFGRAAALLAAATIASVATPLAAAPASIGIAPEIGIRTRRETPVVVMVVSPRMVFALREWPRMRRGAEAAGFSVVTFRDPRVGDGEWRGALRRLGLASEPLVPRLPDAALAGVGVQNHFPSSVVVLGQRVHPWPVLGVMPDAAFVSLLTARLRQLRQEVAR